MSQGADDCWGTWFDASQQGEIDRAIQHVYDQLDKQVAAKQPVCEQSGRCCKFDSYGHRLYVTGLEIARFLTQAKLGDLPRDDAACGSRATHALALPVLSQDPVALDGCVFQVQGLCEAHAIRPLGCRIYFCQPGTEHWQQDIYESHMATLRALHTQHDLPYRYMEWRAGLAEAKRWAAQQGS